METIEIAIKKVPPRNDIERWIEEVINGGGGFKSMEYYECCVYPDREVGIAEFVIRCLANVDCKGSEEVLNAIIERRKSKTLKNEG